MSREESTKITEQEKEMLKLMHDSWMEAHDSEVFRLREFNLYKNSLMGKYGVDVSEYFLDVITGKFMKREGIMDLKNRPQDHSRHLKG